MVQTFTFDRSWIVSVMSNRTTRITLTRHGTDFSEKCIQLSPFRPLHRRAVSTFGSFHRPDPFLVPRGDAEERPDRAPVS